MAKGWEVLNMLCPGVELTVSGNDYENINWHGNKPAITKKQFDDGFAQFDAWQVQQDADKTLAKSNLLKRLGLTEDEAKLLLS